MTTDGEDRDSHFLGAVQDTLDAVVPPRVRDALIHDALALGGFSSIPRDGAALAAFTRGPLRAVAAQALGPALADTIAEEILRSVVRSMQRPSGTRQPPARVSRSPRHASPSQAARRSSAPPPALPRPAGAGFHPVLTPVPLGTRRKPTPAPFRAHGASFPPGPTSTIRPNLGARATEPAPGQAARPTPPTPLVLVATAETLLFETLTEWFDQRATIARVGSPIDLVRKVDAGAERRVVVILDGKHPSIRPAALAALLEELPRVEVVMCRTPPALEHVVLSGLPSTERWVIYREPASLDHVAAECVRLVS